MTSVHVYDRDYVPPAPPAVRALRLLLFAAAALTLVTVGGYVSASGDPVPVVVGQATWVLVPAAIAFVVARRLGTPSRRLHRWASAAAVLWTVGAVATLGTGDPRGLTQLALPVALLMLLRRRSTLEYVDRIAVGAGGPPPAPRRSRMVRLGGGIGLARDSGQGTLEYVGVLAAAVVVVAVVAVTVQAQQPQVSGQVEELVCQFAGDPGCADPGAASPGEDGEGGQDDSTGSGDEDRAADREACEGLLGCAWEVVKQVGSGVFNVAKGAWDDLVGIWELIQDPGKLIDAIEYLIENPTELWKLIWDDETAAMWAAGDYGGAIGRLVWNVGSFFIPGVNLAKLAGKGGKFGKLADLAGELAGARRLADDAGTAADRAADAARRGDAGAAAEAAQEARKAADEAADAARRRGCPVAAGSAAPDDAVVAHGASRPVHAVTAVGAVLGASRVLAAGDCGDLTDAAAEADEAADVAEGVASTPQHALDTLDTIDQTGAAPPGYRGGGPFQNDGRGGGEVLPRTDADGGAVTYREWDVNPYTPGVNRGAERLVTGSDGSVYWTDDHYGTFTRIR